MRSGRAVAAMLVCVLAAVLGPNLLYQPYPYEARDGREDPEARGARVNRGGSWYYGPWYVRTTYRATADQGYRRVRDLGARCVR